MKSEIVKLDPTLQYVGQNRYVSMYTLNGIYVKTFKSSLPQGIQILLSFMKIHYHKRKKTHFGDSSKGILNESYMKEYLIMS